MSKLFEGWEKLFQKLYLSTTIGRDYSPLLSNPAKDSLSKLREFFGQNGYVADIRNNFGFHYPDKLILASLPDISEHEDWGIYLTNSNGNSLYFAADMIAGRALLHLIDPKDHSEAFNRMLKDSSFLVAHFMHVINECMFVFIRRHLPIAELGEPNFSVKATPIETIRLPYFVDPSYYARTRTR